MKIAKWGLLLLTISSLLIVYVAYQLKDDLLQSDFNKSFEIVAATDTRKLTYIFVSLSVLVSLFLNVFSFFVKEKLQKAMEWLTIIMPFLCLGIGISYFDYWWVMLLFFSSVCIVFWYVLRFRKSDKIVKDEGKSV